MRAGLLFALALGCRNPLCQSLAGTPSGQIENPSDPDCFWRMIRELEPGRDDVRLEYRNAANV